MTADERLAETEARAHKKLNEYRTKLAKIHAARRARAAAALAERQALVGKLAHEAGLLGWSDATLAGLFQVLARFRDTPNPVAALEGLLWVNGGEEEKAVQTIA